MVADFDLDGDSDLSDAFTFLECFSGPGNPKRDECLDADTDFDDDVDRSDAVQMMANFGRVE